MWFNRLDNRSNLNANNRNLDNANRTREMTLVEVIIMKTYKNLYPKIYSLSNLILAWRKARKGKTRKSYVVRFEKNIEANLLTLHEELKSKTYEHQPLKNFIVRDPKTRRISKSHFRDRFIHHALINIIGPVFEKTFIHDSCANQIGKGSLFAINRFQKFSRKVTNNYSSEAYCLKADIKKYFNEVDHKTLLRIIKKKVQCQDTIWLIKQILNANFQSSEREREREKLVHRCESTSFEEVRARVRLILFPMQKACLSAT